MKPGIACGMLVGISLAVFGGTVSACQVVSGELEGLAVGGPEAEVKRCFEEHAEFLKLRYENLRIITATSTEEEALVFTLYRGKYKSTGEWQNCAGRAEVENYRGEWSLDASDCVAVTGYCPASKVAWNMATGMYYYIGSYDEWLTLAAKDPYAREVLEEEIIMRIVKVVEDGMPVSRIKDSRLRERVE